MAATSLDPHEAFLYETLRVDLHETIRAYLERTQQPYPIHFVFDLSNMGH
jgi:hypothetical protein